MPNTQHKPVSQNTPAAARPVAGARARALQEQIRNLREQAREAGNRLLETDAQNQERRLQEWKQAEQACQQAEQEMVLLRAQALGAAPETPPAAPASPEASTSIPSFMDPELGWDRRQAALEALNLLERSSQPLLQNSPILERGLALASDTANVTATSIDFGPLVEEAPAPAPLREAPVPAPKAAAPTPVPVRRPPAPTRMSPQVSRPAAQGPRPRPATQRKASPTPRSPFGTALLAGSLFGAGCLLAAAMWLGKLPGLQ